MPKEENDKELDRRVSKLLKDGLFIEAYYITGAEIEATLQILVKTYEKALNLVSDIEGLKYTPLNDKNFNKLTLGRLIEIYSRFTENKKIIEELEKHNTLRNKIVHHLLDQSIEDTEKEVKASILDHTKLMRDLYREAIKVQKKVNEIKRRN